MEHYEITARIQRLRESYKKLPVPGENNPYVDKKYHHFCTGDRWITLGYLEGWLANEKAPTARMRRSYAEAAELYAAQPVILDDELLLGHLYLPVYTPEEQARYDYLVEAYRMSNTTMLEMNPRIDHLGMDFDKLLSKGLDGLMAEIQEKLDSLDLDDPDVYPDYEVLRRYDFYTCCMIELKALRDLEMRYAAAAREKAKDAGPDRKKELLQMADVIERVPCKPAETFREAVQSVHFFLSTLFGLYPMNRPDRYLLSFYEKDLAAGRISRREAQDLIDNFCLGVSDRVFSRAACGFIVGGQNADGSPVENDLTWMFITALDHIRMPDPNGALAVNADTSDELLAYCAEVLSHGTTHPAFFNDEVIVNAMVKYGCEREHAVGYIHTTCAEISVPGYSRSHSTAVCIDLPRCLMEAAESISGEADYEEIRRRYIDNIAKALKKDIRLYILRMMEAARNGNEPMRTSVLINNCIERGRSVQEGGEKYTFLQPIFVGFSTTVDSLTAIKKLVFDEKVLTLEAFIEIVRQNYKDNETLRQYIIHKLPHYGNDEKETDGCARWLGESIEKMLHTEKILGGRLLMPGTFSYVTHASRGARFGATFDGRPAAVSYSDGCGPVQGRDTNGPTAMVLSMTSWDQSMFMGGMVVNIKFSPEHLTKDNSGNFTSVLRSFISRGGVEMQVNVVDRAVLVDACEHPEQHEDLIVRIGGFSDYFVRLTDTLKKEIIERTEY